MNFFINYEGNYEEQRIVYFKKVCCVQLQKLQSPKEMHCS